MYTSLPCADSQRSPALGISPLAVSVALEDVEHLGSEATGALLFGSPSDANGTVLVERGRVCWASARSMRRRLTELLSHQTTPPLDASIVEEVYRLCSRERRPLGETLVDRGIVSEAQLMRALRQHNAEAMAVMSVERRKAPAFVPHRRARYDARFTFSPGELLADVGALRAPEQAVLARKQLRTALEAGGSGAAFLLEPEASNPVPMAIEGADDLGAAGILALGRWAKDALDVAQACCPRGDFFLGRTTLHAGAAAWTSGGVLFAVLAGSFSEAACLVARRSRGGLSGGETR